MRLSAYSTITLVLAVITLSFPVTSLAEEVDGTLPPAVLSISTEFSGAYIYLNGVPVGVTPIDSVGIAPGKYTITARSGEYSASDINATFESGQEEDIFIRLSNERNRSWFRPGAFWAGVGLGVVVLLSVVIISFATSGFY